MSEEIINGVNVAECEFLRHCVIPDNEGCKIDDSLCCDVGNCYFKQLKRLQAENELLKRLLNEKVKTLDKMTGIYSARLCKKYKQALEEIREIAQHWLNNDWSCYYCRQNMDNKLDDILDKISEVLDE